MNASEAKGLAFSSVDEEIKQLESAIRYSAMEGGMSISVRRISAAAMDYLIGNGFKIRKDSAFIVVISWNS